MMAAVVVEEGGVVPVYEEVGELLCEGYLVKLRGFARNRKRWFRVTTGTVSFYERDGGRCIATTPRSNISRVADAGATARNFTLVTTLPFGKSGQSSMTLQAPSIR